MRDGERSVVRRLAASIVELAWRVNGTEATKFLDPIDRAVLQVPVDT